MKPIAKTFTMLAACAALLVMSASADTTEATGAAAKPLRGSSGYTPYDWCGLRWAQNGGEMVWVNTGAEAVRLLVSKADSSGRPDWIFCSQGAVAGQVARGARLVVLATVYVSPDAVRPVFRVPRVPLAGSRSQFIARSSIEVAFDNLLEKEKVDPATVRRPTGENPTFSTIVSLLRKPASDDGAIDFAVLVEPFITNLMAAQPGGYEVGAGGIYELNYCLVAREEDVRTRRADFVALLKNFAAISAEVETYTSDEQFYSEVWGKKENNAPARLPKLLTFSRSPARLQLAAAHVREQIRTEISHLVRKHPADLAMPSDLGFVVDDSLLRDAAPARSVP